VEHAHSPRRARWTDAVRRIRVESVNRAEHAVTAPERDGRVEAS
jgi:hypothetical protein